MEITYLVRFSHNFKMGAIIMIIKKIQFLTDHMFSTYFYSILSYVGTIFI